MALRPEDMIRALGDLALVDVGSGSISDPISRCARGMKSRPLDGRTGPALALLPLDSHRKSSSLSVRRPNKRKFTTS
jgi:hypothetical protein